MPKLHPFEHKEDFPNLETFNIYKQQLPGCANYESKFSEKCHICKTNKHKMRIQYGKCTNAACLCL
jgi:hypothetical protein